MLEYKPSVQIWDLNTLAKIREQELHDKGVKCIDINNKVILTGSYDATLKVRYLQNFSLTRSLNANDINKIIKLGFSYTFGVRKVKIKKQ